MNFDFGIEKSINSISDRMSFLLESSIESVGKEEFSKFEEAIQAYEDEKLTGLTKEEKEKIKKELAEFAEKNNLKMPDDAEALLAYAKGLLQKYGYKGDIEEYAETFLLSDESPVANGVEQDKAISNIMNAYNNLKNSGVRI